MLEYAHIDRLTPGGTYTWQLTEAVRIYIWRHSPSDYSINFQCTSLSSYSRHARSALEATKIIGVFDHEMYEIAMAIFSDHATACIIAIGDGYGKQD
jgi:hypothetical protein